MRDKEANRQIKRIRRLQKRWRQALGLWSWEITHNYHRGPFQRVDGSVADSNVAAECQVRWQYVHATVNWNLQVVSKLKDDKLEWCFIHEMMHVLLHEMREEGIDHEERVASVLAWAFTWTRDQGRKEAASQ